VLLLLALLLCGYIASAFSPALHQHPLTRHGAAARQAAEPTTASNMTAASAAALALGQSSDHDLRQTGRQLQGVPKNILQFTGVKFETPMRAKASMVSGEATAAAEK
jgi:hypothetical protein